MQKLSRAPSELPTQPRVKTPAGCARSAPVKVWALAGGLLLVFQFYVITSWLLGPNFKRVPSGPSVPPGWMKAFLIGWQIVPIPLMVVILYWFLVRPWRREGRPTTDGLLCLAFLFVSFQDPLINHFGH